VLLLEPERALVLTDPRYTTQVLEEADCAAKVVRGATLKSVPPLLEKRRLSRLGVEAGHLTVESYSFLESATRGKTSLRPLAGVVEWLRLVKSEEEIALIREAVKVTSRAFARALKKVREGIREQELAAELDFQMLRAGAERPAFETIVAFGPRAALPHARPTFNSLQSNELLLIDMGAQRQGYASDMTRVAHWGRPNGKTRALHGAVLEAQLAAVDAVRPGATAHSVDRAARSTLRKHGLDRQFLHSTGHGLGLEIHEAPRLGKKETATLEAGMVITIEPGVYLENSGGVRIEDTVVVTANGCEVLTPTPKELLVL
jgi:Xaa-Pro aminopeptidase